MIDLEVTQDAGTAGFDLRLLPNGDLAAVNSLSSAVLASLLTDKRADAQQVATPQLRGGWIGDALDIGGFELGSLLWTLEPAKLTQQNLALAASFAREALQWLIDEGIATEVEASGEFRGAQQGGLDIRIRAPDGTVETQYVELWRQTTFKPTALPAALAEAVAFAPDIVPGLMTYYNANRSQHTIDELCGVSAVEDQAGTADINQASQAARPLRVRTSGGWHYQFLGDRNLASFSAPFPSIRQATVFMIIKPRAGAVLDGRMLTFGFTGFADAVRGLSIRQGATNEVRLFGDAGSLDTTISSDGASIGIVARWGDAVNGGSLESSDDLAALAGAYANDLTAPNRLVLGAGFDGANVDDTVDAAFELAESATYSRRITDQEALQLLDYAEFNPIVSGVGEPSDDCHYWSDDTGYS